MIPKMKMSGSYCNGNYNNNNNDNDNNNNNIIFDPFERA